MIGKCTGAWVSHHVITPRCAQGLVCLGEASLDTPAVPGPHAMPVLVGRVFGVLSLPLWPLILSWFLEGALGGVGGDWR